jgi:hypothetical protein
VLRERIALIEVPPGGLAEQRHGLADHALLVVGQVGHQLTLRLADLLERPKVVTARGSAAIGEYATQRW